MKNSKLMKIIAVLLMYLVTSPVCFGQFFPEGGYQGGNHNSGGDETKNVPYIILDLKVYLEGAYNGTDMNTSLNTQSLLPLSHPYDTDPTAIWYYAGTEKVGFIPGTDIVDWIIVELRETPYSGDSATGNTIIAQEAAFLLDDGSVVALDGASDLKFYVGISDSLFVTIWHRNHLGIMSSIALTESGGVYAWDFSSGMNQVYGGLIGHKHLGGGVYGMIGGDGDPDGQITNADKIEVWFNQAGNSGYLAGDFSMNGQVNNPDKLDIWSPNSGKGSVVPDNLSVPYQCQVPR